VTEEKQKSRTKDGGLEEGRGGRWKMADGTDPDRTVHTRALNWTFGGHRVRVPVVHAPERKGKKG
jgi:hypothetical protein